MVPSAQTTEALVSNKMKKIDLSKLFKNVDLLYGILDENKSKRNIIKIIFQTHYFQKLFKKADNDNKTSCESLKNRPR